jgi:hypothetical protein
MKFLIMQFPQLSLVQIFSAPCSQTPSVCVPPFVLETEYRTHTEPQAKFSFVYHQYMEHGVHRNTMHYKSNTSYFVYETLSCDKIIIINVSPLNETYMTYILFHELRSRHKFKQSPNLRTI